MLDYASLQRVGVRRLTLGGAKLRDVDKVPFRSDAGFRLQRDSVPFDLNIVTRLIDAPRPYHRERLMNRSKRALNKRLKINSLRRDRRVDRMMDVHKGLQKGQERDIEDAVAVHSRKVSRRVAGEQPSG